MTRDLHNRLKSAMETFFFKVQIGKSRSSQVTLVVKNPPADAGDVRDAGLILRSGRSPGTGNGNTLQHSCWKTP